MLGVQSREADGAPYHPAAQSTQWETKPMARGHGDLICRTDVSVVGGESYLFVTYDEDSKYINQGGSCLKEPAGHQR